MILGILGILRILGNLKNLGISGIHLMLDSLSRTEKAGPRRCHDAAPLLGS